MAYFPEQFIQQILQSADIVEIVSQYVALKQKGREFVGLCPFHEDHKPSMFVAPAKQIYKCFSCGAGGNAIQFVMGFEKLTFPEAVRSLAERLNIPLPQDNTTAPQSGGLSRSLLIAAVEAAGKFYREALFSSAGSTALAYARHRGISDESLEKFGIGFAPDSWDSISQNAAQLGCSTEQLVAAGLVKRRDNGPGCYDYFRNRLMFPIHDISGRTIAFGGRALADDEKAKYLNSPESVLFDKSSLVYGLSFARDKIVKSKQVVVAEGYFDVLMPHQYGITNIVATLGTSLTERHVRLLGRYAGEAILLFDADTAGAAATERAIQLFLAQKLHVRVATIPSGKDPCDFVIAQGATGLQKLIDDAPGALQYAWDIRCAALMRDGADNPTERNRLIDEFLNIVVTSGAYGAIDETRRSNLAQHIAHIVNIPAIDLQQKMRQLARTVRPSHTTRNVQQNIPQKNSQNAGLDNASLAVNKGAPTTIGASGNPEREILEVLLDAPDLFDDVAERIDPHFFHDAMFNSIAQRVWEMGLAGKFSPEDLMAREDMASLGATLSELAWGGQKRGNHQKTLTDAVAAILDREEKRKYLQLKEQSLTAGVDDNKLRQLQERLSSIHQQGGHSARRPKIQ